MARKAKPRTYDVRVYRAETGGGYSVPEGHAPGRCIFDAHGLDEVQARLDAFAASVPYTCAFKVEIVGAEKPDGFLKRFGRVVYS